MHDTGGGNMKILLAIPGKGFTLEATKKIVLQPMGLLYIAGYIRQYRDDDIRILDLRIYSPKAQKRLLFRTLQRFQPDIVGVSATTFESEQMYDFAADVKGFCSSIIVVGGGPHVTAYPLETLANINFDYGIIGEGEAAFLQFLNSLEGEKNLADVMSLVYRRSSPDDNTEKPDIVVNDRAPFLDMDKMPLPAWDLVKLSRYEKHDSMSMCGPRKFACIFTTRGCPYRCTYCHNIFGKEFRTRPIESVIEEILLLRNTYGITDIEIIDDCFNFDRQRATEILEGIIELNLNMNFQFPNGLRADLLDEQIIALMAKAGVNYAALAVETASKRLQCLIRKYLDLPKTKEVIALMDRAGIYTTCFFMFGFPGETRKEMHKTIEFARTSRLNQAHFFKVIPFKNTGLWKYAPAEMRDTSRLAQYNYNTSRVNISAVSDMDFQFLYLISSIKFYSISRIIRGLARIPLLNRSAPSWHVVAVYYLKKIYTMLFRLFGQFF